MHRFPGAFLHLLLALNARARHSPALAYKEFDLATLISSFCKELVEVGYCFDAFVVVEYVILLVR